MEKKNFLTIKSQFIDDLSGGAPDYSYEIYVFRDNDTDGIDDHAE